MKSIKSIAGTIGRKYLKERFEPFRKFCYDTFNLPFQAIDIIGIYIKQFFLKSENSIFFTDFYSASNKPQNRIEKSGIICMYDGKLLHGGPTDRMKGALTTFHEAKKRKIPFYIYWTKPFPLDRYIIPATFDWRISDSELSYYKRDAFPVIIMETTEYQSHLNNWLRLKSALFFRRKQTHVYSNADNQLGTYAPLYKQLFKPSPLLQKSVDKALNEINAPYWAFTFRFLQLLGDFKDHLQVTLSDMESDMLINELIAEFRKIIEDIPEGYKILVTSDSSHFLDVMRTVDSRVYIVPGEVINIDLGKGIHNDAWLKTFTDQQLLMKAERVYLMRTGLMYKSGFPQFAAEVGGAKFIDYHF